MNRKVSISLAIFILFAAAAIRVYFALRCDAAPDYSDMELYNAAALERGFPASLPPGYPLFLRAVYAVFGPRNYTAAFVAQGLIGVLIVYLVYRVTSTIGGRGAGLIAAAVAAVYPNLIVYGLTTLSETIGALCVMILYGVLVAPIDDRKKSLWAAVIIGIGFAFRPVILYFAPGVLVSLRKRLAFVIAAAVLLVPLISFEMIQGNSFQRGARGLYKAYNPGSDGRNYSVLERTELGTSDLESGAYLEAAWSYIRNNKARMLETVLNKAKMALSAGWDDFVMRPIVGSGRGIAFMMEYACIPILVLGFIGMSRLYGRDNRMIALPALSYIVFVIVFSIFKYRYRLLIEPVLIVYASMLLSRGFGRGALPRTR